MIFKNKQTKKFITYSAKGLKRNIEIDFSQTWLFQDGPGTYLWYQQWKCKLLVCITEQENYLWLLPLPAESKLLGCCLIWVVIKVIPHHLFQKFHPNVNTKSFLSSSNYQVLFIAQIIPFHLLQFEKLCSTQLRNSPLL